MDINAVTLEQALDVLGRLLADRGHHYETAKLWCITHDVSEMFAKELNKTLAILGVDNENS